jgi:hypothetical protein
VEALEVAGVAADVGLDAGEGGVVLEGVEDFGEGFGGDAVFGLGGTGEELGFGGAGAVEAPDGGGDFGEEDVGEGGLAGGGILEEGEELVVACGVLAGGDGGGEEAVAR